MSRKNTLRIAAAGAAMIAVTALAALFAHGHKPPAGGQGGGGKTVEELLGLDDTAPVYYNGKEYRRNPDLESYLFMGIDKRSGDAHGGHADVLLVLVLDRTRERVTALQLDRDMMTEISVLDNTGEVVKTRTLQLAFAHYYGSGGADSCENTVEAVSKLLYGIKFDGYLALQMESITVLNDLIGGVTVTIEDDFSQSDPELKLGETVTLVGEQAWNYVHDRRNVGDGDNISRMRRHRAYLHGFEEQLMARLEEDMGFAARLYQTAMPYMVTDMGSGTVVDLLNEARNYENAGTVTLEGESRLDVKNDLMEFHADERSIQETVMDLFYLET